MQRVNRIYLLLAAVLMLCVLAPAVAHHTPEHRAELAAEEMDEAEAVEADYHVKTRLFIDGELRGEPELQVKADHEATISVGNDEGYAWRMKVRVESPDEHENAMEGAIWVHIGIDEQLEGEWSYLADTLLGLPAGQTGHISLVDEGVETATPENSNLFVEVMVEPISE